MRALAKHFLYNRNEYTDADQRIRVELIPQCLLILPLKEK